MKVAKAGRLDLKPYFKDQLDGAEEYAFLYKNLASGNPPRSDEKVLLGQTTQDIIRDFWDKYINDSNVCKPIGSLNPTTTNMGGYNTILFDRKTNIVTEKPNPVSSRADVNELAKELGVKANTQSTTSSETITVNTQTEAQANIAAHEFKPYDANTQASQQNNFKQIVPNQDGSPLPHEVVIKEKYDTLTKVKNQDTCYTLSNGTKVACKNAQAKGLNQILAAQLCQAQGMRLPSANELNEIYQNQGKIPNLTDSYDMGGWPYWSASRDGANATRIIFAGGNFGPKGTVQICPIAVGSGSGAYIRCVK